MRKDPPHPAPRILDIARIPRDYMYVEVWHGLSGRLPEVHPDIESVRAMALENRGTRRSDGLCELMLLVGYGIKPRCDVSPWHDERVAGREREAIPEAKYEAPLVKNPFTGRGAEGTDEIDHRSRLSRTTKRPDRAGEATSQVPLVPRVVADQAGLAIARPAPLAASHIAALLFDDEMPRTDRTRHPLSPRQTSKRLRNKTFW